MIQITVNFPTFEAATVALAKLCEGAQIVSEGLASATVETPDKPKGPRGKKATETPALAGTASASVNSEPATLLPVQQPATNAATVTPPAAVAAVVAPAGDYPTRLAAWTAANPGKDALQFMRDHLQKIIDRDGLDRGRSVMAEFGNPRITEVPADKYQTLLAHFDGVLNVVADPML